MEGHTLDSLVCFLPNRYYPMEKAYVGTFHSYSGYRNTLRMNNATAVSECMYLLVADDVVIVGGWVPRQVRLGYCEHRLACHSEILFGREVLSMWKEHRLPKISLFSAMRDWQ